ncbi:glycoprotein hormones alpha chain [Nerophis ophidion]|uniref:glycoprotein hormones alpha chain n=1 Tax=Nerophis ophidion TaxID=159077 RepID=UPI002ADFCAC0|nr:glycoprotein hormones alpha chain [Nerophis ophidion]XP_061751896.1 glycoprotein hormones alpha chain [Nerophis ophidion]
MSATATIMRSVKSAATCLLLLSALLYWADSYPDMVSSDAACNECALKKNELFSGDFPIYQCMGCCFSRAYPTPLNVKKMMMIPKNFTSEATCCIARDSYEVRHMNIIVRNHTGCNCDTCMYHKI